MTPVTLALAYYENPTMLTVQFAAIRALPAALRDLLHVIVVDDGSPNHPALPEEIGCPLQMYRVGVDVRWNQDACRNIAVHHAETEWLLLTDMDHLAPEATWRPLLTRSYDASKVYRFARVTAPEMTPYKPHPNSWFLTRRMFERAGGYDETFAGLYGTDAPFRDQLRKVAEIVMLKEVLIRFPREHVADASTTTYLRKQPEDRDGIAAILKSRERPDYQAKRLTFPYARVA
jgi:hypothetical protein